MHRLVVNPGTAQAWEIQLKRGTNRLGRNADNEFVIRAPGISGSHCQIVVGNEAVVIQDLNSTNGTFIEHQPIQQATLLDGQSVQLGSVEMMYYSETPLSSEDTEPPAAVDSALHESTLTRPRQAGATLSHPMGEGRGEGRSGTVMAPMRDSEIVGASPEPPPLESVPAGPRFCITHPKALAHHVCTKCHRAFCDACVSIRHDQGRVAKFCRSCGVECAPYDPGPIQVVEPEKTFGQRVGTAFLYPLQGDGIILLFTGGLFYMLIDAAGFISRFAGMVGILAIVFLTILGSGYLVSYMRRILTSSAVGENSMPDWPDLGDLSSDILLPFMQLSTTVAFCFAPAIALTVYAPPESPWIVSAIIASVFIGCVYFPMAFTAVAMLDTVMALNPLLVIPSILKIPFAYLAAVALFAAVLLVRWLGHTLLPMIVPMPFVPWIVSNFLGLYLLTVEMRILGLLYLTKKDDLGWFNR
jgi:hypothetical protein